MRGVFNFIVIFVCVCQLGNGQEESSFFEDIFLEGHLHTGYIMPHTKEIEYSVDHHVAAFEVNISKPTAGNYIWEEIYNYPRIGGGYLFTSLSNAQVYGYAQALYPFIDIPLTTNKKFNINTRVAFGLAYLNKQYDAESNYKNIAIGSHINVYFHAALQSRFKLNNALEFSNSVGFTHFSNGKMVAPNLGLNAVTVTGGLGYQFGADKITRKAFMHDVYKKHFEYSVVYCAGLKMLDQFDYKNYFISSLSLNANRRFSNIQAYGLGVDFFIDETLTQKLDRDNSLISKDNFKSGIHLSHDLIYGNLTLVVQLGHYFIQEYEDISNLYSRLGLRYQINKHLLANVTLKSHNANADFIEWGIGYNWR